MGDKREQLFNSYHNLALRLRDLGAVVQNEISNGEELIDLMIGQFKSEKHGFNMSLDMLAEETIEYLKSLKQ